MQAKQVLHKIMINTCPNMHKMRRHALEENVLAALTGQRLTVTDLGRSIKSDTSHKHGIKRADRLLSNSHLHNECIDIYHALSHQIIGAQKRPVILVDWSDMDEYKQHFLVRAALAVEGRSMTLYEEVHTVESKEKLTTHKQFLLQLKKILPENCKPIIVTDAGFRTTWFKLVESINWDWVGRVRNRHDMRWTRGGTWFDAKKCYKKATSQPAYLGEGILTRRHEFRCQFVAYRGKLQGRKHKNRLGDVAKNSKSRKHAAGQREPWLLATSLCTNSTLAKKVVQIYSLRMQIEEGFRDVKSHRFGLSMTYHRTASVKRLQVLLLIATLALMVLWILGMAVTLLKKHYQFQANTVRHKKVLSIIFIGLQMVTQTRICLSHHDISAAWEQLIVFQKHQWWE